MQMTGYTKLFGSIITSTIWREKNETRILWITMLALKNKMGIVEGSIPGLADMARLSIDDTIAALEILRSADPYSRTKENEGRRIQDVEGGWFVINHEKWRRRMNADERREYLTVKQRESRARRSTVVNKSQQLSTPSTHADAYTDKEEVQNASHSLGDDFDKAWKEWAEYRKQAKLKPYTPLGSKKQISALTKLGAVRAIAAIENSIANGYQGIIEPKSGSFNDKPKEPNLGWNKSSGLPAPAKPASPEFQKQLADWIARGRPLGEDPLEEKI